MLLPTWDLLISAVFIAVIAFSFIVGKDVTQKIIISVYIAVLAVDGLAYLLHRLFFAADAAVRILNLGTAGTTYVVLKLFLFVISIVALTSKGSFSASFMGSTKGLLGLVVQATLGFLLAALITSTLLVFLSGACFLPAVTCAPSDLAAYITQGSTSAQLLLSKAYLWFMLPAVALVVSSLVSGGSDD